MTDKLIEQIEADREAGTPGPWIDYEFCGDWFVSNGTDDSGPMLRVGSWHADREANARRIARVPDMEARILADAEVIKAAEVLGEASQRLIDLRENTSPFGGEIMRDRIERTERRFIEALTAFHQAQARTDTVGEER